MAGGCALSVFLVKMQYGKDSPTSVSGIIAKIFDIKMV